jgi:hypothetical protein
MCTEPAPPRGDGEWAFTRILLFPLRAVERARGWRRLGLLLLYVLIAFLILPQLWHRSQLVGLPDVGNRLDAAASRSAAGVPDDRNDFVPYQRAAERFREMSEDEGESFSNADLRWSRSDATLRGERARQGSATQFHVFRDRPRERSVWLNTIQETSRVTLSTDFDGTTMGRPTNPRLRQAAVADCQTTNAMVL